MVLGDLLGNRAVRIAKPRAYDSASCRNGYKNPDDISNIESAVEIT